MHTSVLEALVEAAEHIEDDGTIRNMFPKLADGVVHVLEAVVVVGDGELPLGEVAKLGIEEESPIFLIVEVLGLDDKLGSMGSGVALHDGFGEVGG